MAKFMPAIAVCSAWKGQDERCRTQRGVTFFFTPRFLIFLPQLVFFFAVVLILNAALFAVELILNAVLPQLMEAHSGGRRVRREFLASIIAASKRHAKKRRVAKQRACKQEQRTAEQAESNDRLREPSALVVLQYALGAPSAFFAGRCLPPQVHAASLVFRRRCQGKEGPKRRSE